MKNIILVLTVLLLSVSAFSKTSVKSPQNEINSFLKICSQKIASGLKKQTLTYANQKDIKFQPTGIELSDNCSEVTVRYLISSAANKNQIFSCMHKSATSKVDLYSRKNCDDVTEVEIDVQKGVDFVDATVARMERPSFKDRLSADLKSSVEAKLSFEEKLDDKAKNIRIKKLYFDLDKNVQSLKIGDSVIGEYTN